MLKFMKYEFRKQAWSKGIILFLAAILEIVFLIGIFLDKEDYQGIGLGFLMTLSFAAIVYVGFECVDTFSKDLKTKCSYMLFLTPHTSYSILGAKIITSAIQIIVTGFAFLGLFILDGFIMISRYGKWKDIVEFVRQLIDQLLHIKVDIQGVVIMILMLLVGWLFFIVLSFFAITLSTTFLANKKFKGFVSFLIFVVISWVISYIQNKLFGKVDFSQTLMWYSIAYLVVITVITYIGTAFMLEKKVSL